MKRRISLVIFILVSIAAIFAEQIKVPGFGTITVQKTAEGYSVPLGKLGTFVFTGEISPSAFQLQMKSFSTKVKHSVHTFNKCYNDCVPDYANHGGGKMYAKAEQAINKYAASLRPKLQKIEGGDASDTRTSSGP